MRKLLLLFTLMFSVISFSQKKAVKLVTSKHSAFDKETTYIGNAGSLGVYGVKKDTDSICSYKVLTITVYDSYLTYASDLTILFEDGTTINLDTDEDYPSYDSSYKLYRYYNFAYPTSDEWLIIETKKIVGIKYHIFERKYLQHDKLSKIIKQIK